ncbi:hypothetical protein HF086_005340 [Spodoptera exigua]|uniref:HAT C-terminal dimerisation domain-containing protein n=1 Tax=Spodoptera exigua TaxID=7107 RepID=A0A922MQR0_SPOEX|nr:hypothetical protein HF086_005340 [Spodoptera exigua]
MKNHLKAKHPDKFSEIYGGSSSCVVPAISTSSTASTCTTASQPSLQKQLTLAETVERKQYWGINDSKSQEFHYLIGEMIALDNEPLSIVDRVGFNRLMQKAVPSGANMVKGVQVAEYDSARCFIHSLQRVITESLKTQPDLVEMLNAARRIVTHFNHSALAQEKLKAIQKELKLPEHRLQWNLMEQCIILLKPFEEITKITSSGLSCISEVIPHVAVLMRYIQKEETSRKVPNLLQFLTSLKTQLQQRFEHLDENLKYFLATLLDPRFKTNFFGVIQAEKARQSLLLEGLKLSCGEEDASSSGGDSPPLKKRAGSSMSVHDSFWDCFNEVVKDNNQTEDSDNTAIANELDFYLKMVPLDRKSDPYAWWAANAKQFPILVKFAQIYLSSPCSSVYSERLFSEAGLVYENKRKRLLPKNAENLVFIHHNLPLVDFQY